MASYGHVAHNVLQILVNLEGDGKGLGIASLLRGKTLKGVESPILFVTFIISKWSIVYVIKHVMLHTIGTLMVAHYSQDQRFNSRSQSQPGNSFLDFFKRATSSPRRLRRDLILGITYNAMYAILITNLESISSSTLWTFASNILTAILLSSFHLRWTTVIVSPKPFGLRISKRPQRDLVLPVVAYTSARELTERFPQWLNEQIMIAHVQGSKNMRVIAAGDSIVLFLALGLRMLVLYPVWGVYVYIEMLHLRKKVASLKSFDRDDFGDPALQGDELKDYGSVLYRFWKKLTVRWGVLYLQTACALVVVECIAFFLFNQFII